jgi:hypothetical protein
MANPDTTAIPAAQAAADIAQINLFTAALRAFAATATDKAIASYLTTRAALIDLTTSDYSVSPMVRTNLIAWENYLGTAYRNWTLLGRTGVPVYEWNGTSYSAAITALDATTSALDTARHERNASWYVAS